MFALRAPAAPAVRAPAPAAARQRSVAARAEAAVADAPAAETVAPPTVVVLEKKRSRRFKEAKAKVRGIGCVEGVRGGEKRVRGRRSG
jgi:hypothetical protein